GCGPRIHSTDGQRKQQTRGGDRIMTPNQLHQLASEEESRIVESVFLTQQRGRYTVMFVSPDRNAGCSWTVARLGRNLARRVQGSVCIVDANLRWPSIHNLFWIDNTRGL